MAFEWSKSTYKVFLSFRGEDTRKNFSDHLYAALTRAGVSTFRDDNGIHRGENIPLEIENAIKESRLSVIVLSKDYASSPWCLDEIVLIMERKRNNGHIALPVFYDVSPSQVWNQTESYAEAFARHENELQDDLERVRSWREALKEVANLGGMVLQDRHESQFIQDIVDEVEKKLSSIPLFGPNCAWNGCILILRWLRAILIVIYVILLVIFLSAFLPAWVSGVYQFVKDWIYSHIVDPFRPHSFAFREPNREEGPTWQLLEAEGQKILFNRLLGIAGICLHLL